MTATQALHAAIYRHRYHAKQVLRVANSVLPEWAGRRLKRLAEQVAFRVVPQYQGDTLPPIFHYWSGRHVAPTLSRIGLGRPEDLFLVETERRAREAKRPVVVVSLGAGSCSLELWLAAALQKRGVEAKIECVDFNAALIRHGAGQAEARGLSNHMSFTVADCTQHAFSPGTDVIIVNQFFHHVERLESFCARLQAMLDRDGVLLTTDIVGRSGHLPWPAVDAVVQAHWKDLPPTRRFDRYFNARRDRYVAIDHSSYSNEGVRAQDIVRCLSDVFDFSTFLTFGGAVMPFVERRIGFNFDPAHAPDRSFIDRVARRDDAALAKGEYPGSNMVAVLRHKGSGHPTFFHPVSPDHHLRMTAEQLALAAETTG